jgi:hypothetical protein
LVHPVSRRQSQRHSIGSLVRGDGEIETYFAVELSRSGMKMLRLADAGPVGAHFTVEIPLPGYGRSVHAVAERVRTSDRGPLREVGVRFRYVAPEDQRTLDAYLAARADA